MGSLAGPRCFEGDPVSGRTMSGLWMATVLMFALAVLVVLAPPLAAGQQDDQKNTARRERQIPIMTWPGPDASLLNAEAFRLVSGAGFSVNASFLGSREGNLKALDLAQQAGIQQSAMLQQMAQSAPGGAPSAGTPDQQAGAARQARMQAAQQAAPTGQPGQPAPATQAGQAANQTKVSTLVQDGGAAMNRIVSQGTMPGG